ncbi:MAG: Ig-like domain-containing protein [Acidobacteria bacterium]|nr:Ig-like domain-containing protein [Acidobacteriota bacterium]
MMNKHLVAILVLGAAAILAAGQLLVAPADAAKAKYASSSKKGSAVRVLPVQTPAYLEGQSATLLPDGRWLLTGGAGREDSMTAAEIKDPRTNSVAPLPGRLRHGRAGHTATLLPDGKVLILGGVDEKGKLVKFVELFDPEAQSSEPLPAADLVPRAYHTATLLIDGRVLLAGGRGDKDGALSEVVLWNPRTTAAEAVGDGLQTARRKHSATLLPGGKVLVWGGSDRDGVELAGGEIYDPVTQTFSWTGVELGAAADGAAPYVETSSPQDGATNIPGGVVIALRFSKRLRVESVNAENVRLESTHGPTAAKVVPAEAGILAFVTPLEPLRPGTLYTLSLENSSDLSNQKIVPATVSFTTAPGMEEGGTRGPAADGEEWTPSPGDLRGDWSSRRSDSPWQKLPPLQVAAGETALAGQVLLLNGRPLAGVTLRISGRTAVTDSTGRFLLRSLTKGHHVLYADGRTANNGNREYCLFKIGVDVETGQTSVLPFTIWMPRVDTKNAVEISSPTRNEVAITTPYIPGLEVRLPQGVVVRDTEGRTVSRLSITPIPVDRPPFPLPSGVRVPVFFTVQAGASQVIPPRARVIYPNYTNEAPGTRISFWNYDPAEKGWYVYGQGSVTADGRQVVPDAGVVVYEFTGFMIGAGNAPPNIGPPCGSCAQDGDPVDLATGLFLYEKSDLILPDTLPLVLKRTYRPLDNAKRAFGIGTTHPYELFMSGGSPVANNLDLILPDGGRVPYVRIGGTGFRDAVFESVTTPSAFYKSKVVFNTSTEKWELSLKSGSTYIFPQYAPLEAIRDRHGNTVTIIRTGGTTGPISRVTSSNGRWISFTYDASNRVTQAKDNIGRTVTYTYDASGRLWKVTDAKGGVTEYTYDTTHRMLTVKDARGITYLTNEYDSSGKVKKQTQADGSTYQFIYTLNSGGKVTQADVTNPRGNVRRVTFNDQGYLLTDTYGLGKPEQQTTTYERQAGSNLPLNVMGPTGYKTSFMYDSMGNVTAVKSMTGTSAEATSSYTYEPVFNRVASFTDPLNRTTSFAYDGRGNLTGVTDPLGHQTTFTYNGAGQVTSATDPLNNITHWTYDSGDLSQVIDPLGRGVQFFTDNAGRVVSVTNPLGQITTREYDALNQLVKMTDPLAGVTNFAYDTNGNLLSVTDARGKVTSYTYNNMDRAGTRTDPLLRVESYEYDADGNLKKFTDRRGRVTSHLYDSLGRRTFTGFGETLSGGVASYESTVSYAYDADDRLTQVTDSQAGTITRSYNDLARTYSEATPQGTVNHAYDAAGRRVSMTVAGQPAVSYAYDAGDRLTGITQAASSVAFAYDDAGRRTSLTLPNGVVVEYGYDEASQLTGLSYKLGGSVLGDLTYEYDGAGRRAKVGGSYARTGLPQALASAAYDDANQLLQRGSTNFTYDANGNLTSDGVNTYTWDARNRLASISGGTTASFSYDAFGGRTGRTTNGQTTSYLYDGANAVQELSGSTPVANMLAGGVDEVFSRADGAGAKTLLADGLGSTLGLLDSSGAVETNYTYEPFGGTAQTGSVSDNTTQYVGREHDGATGLYYYRARYYSPTLGRFISEDPIGFAGGDENLYAYVGNDPVNHTDPSGLSAWKKLIKIFTQRGELIESFRKPLSRDAKLEKIKDGIDEARRKGNHPGAVVQTPDQNSAKTVAEGLDPNGTARGPEESGGGYPEHYNPSSGPYEKVHVQWEPPHKRLAIILAPFSMELSGRKDTTNMQMFSAGIWDVASTIDPVGITDACNWFFGLD